MRCFVNSPLRRTTHVAAAMKLELVVHETEEGGYWAEAPAIPGCATQADSFEELLDNLHEAIEGCLCVDVRDVAISPGDLDVAVLRIARGGSGDADRLETFEVPCRDHIHPAQRDQRLDHRAQRPPLQRLAYPPIRTRHATARLPCEKLDRTSLRQNVVSPATSTARHRHVRR